MSELITNKRFNSAPNRTRPNSWHPFTNSEILFLILVAIWGITFVITKAALEVIGPFAYNTLRFVAGGLVLILLTGPKWRQVGWRYIWPSLWVGVVLYLAYSTQVWGQQYTTAAKAGFLTGTSLVYVPIISAILLRKRPAGLAIVGVLLALSGLLLVSFQGEQLAGFGLAAGDSMIALSGFGWAIYMLGMAHYVNSPDIDILPFGALQVIVAAGLSLMTWVIQEPMIVPWSDRAVIVGILTTGVLILGFGTSIHGWVMQSASPTRVTVMTTLEPIFAALAGFWIGETITAATLIGGGLIFAGMLFNRE